MIDSVLYVRHNSTHALQIYYTCGLYYLIDNNRKVIRS